MNAGDDRDAIASEIARLASRSKHAFLLGAPGLLLLVAAIAYGVVALDSLNSKLGEARRALDTTKVALTSAEAEKQRALEERDAMLRDAQEVRAKLAVLTKDLDRVAPSAITLVLASETQRADAARLQQAFDKIARTRVIVAPNGPIPYVTEVRYFRYPEDLEVAQRVLLMLQSDFGLVLSRISYVRDPDPHPPGTIAIHFNAKPLR